MKQETISTCIAVLQSISVNVTDPQASLKIAAFQDAITDLQSHIGTAPEPVKNGKAPREVAKV